MKVPVSPRILAIEPYRPGKPIDEVKRELGLSSVIKLASNESPYGPSPRVLKAIRQSAQQINRYPDGGCYYLRRALAKRLKVAEDRLIFGNGSDEIIVMALRAFLRAGEEVVIAKPSFLIYEIASKIAGAKVRAVPLIDFCYDLDGMRRAVTARTRIIFIGNPDNPAGTYISKSELRKFVRSIRRDILIFVDEAYFEFVTGRDYPDSIDLQKEFANVITTRTFSKMYGLAGLRVGYGVAHKDIIDVLNRVREPFNINSLAQAAAVACLQDQVFYRRIARSIEAQRQFIYQELRRLGLSFVPSATNFILIDVGQLSKPVSDRLLKRGVIVRDMEFWGLKRYIRVTIGSSAENKRFIKALRASL